MMQPVFLLPLCEEKGVVEAGAILLESGETSGLVMNRDSVVIVKFSEKYILDY